MEKELLAKQHTEKVNALAGEVISLARDNILMNMRFLDVALSHLKPVQKNGLVGVASDASHFYYDPYYILRRYKAEHGAVIRMLLHSLMHCIFYHSFSYDKLDRVWWNLAADMAVEHTILEMKIPGTSLKRDTERMAKLQFYEKEAYGLTAEKLYKYFKFYPLLEEERLQMEALFGQDLHLTWEKKEEEAISLEQWKKISERVKADLKSFSKGKTNSESLEKNLEEATRERYNYADFLKRFMVSGEDIHINDEEFDYIYYTYGLEHYGNMPLIEPLEYCDVHRIKDFVIAIDTSASCRGKIVRAFLNKTYNIMKQENSFFHKMNVHIIQCDNEVRSDVKITNDEEFEAFMKTGKITGFGSTDFRPVFEYVNQLKENGAFDDLKGLIYFTDGYGIYPEKMPEYQVAFAFLEEDERRLPVPPWAIKLILESEELENEH